MSILVDIIRASDPENRDRSLDSVCRGASAEMLHAECVALDRFRRQSANLYERVRALFFLYAIHRFHLPRRYEGEKPGHIPHEGVNHLLKRRFEEALEIFLTAQRNQGPSDALSSALASAYHRLAFQTLADQVRRSVRSVRGNQWMFRIGHPADHPLRIRPELVNRSSRDALFPIIRETTPVRMDLTHSGWSDIFFLGMDFPEGARVLNVSVDLSVRGENGQTTPKPPIETYFRVIDEPILRLVSVDLNAVADISTLAEVFDFARDHLGLLKAAVIASGIVPPGMEGASQPLSDLLEKLVGPGLGIEIVSQVNDIPKGSRLAVSTNLLASLIAVCMRATDQTRSLTGTLREEERRTVAARAILGEWLGGSGGGWQDSGGIWPGIKLIEGVNAVEGDPEFGVSRGRLLPHHMILEKGDVARDTSKRLQDSLVLVHGGMAQDVGPILEMVTEKYLLRSDKEWRWRQAAIKLLDDIVRSLRDGDVKSIGAITQRNFDWPIQTIIPWASNYYTESLIDQVRKEFGDDFWGFWMLGGMSGGGMGFIFDPKKKKLAVERLQAIMNNTKTRLEKAIPFAMDPVVYDFAINEAGTEAQLMQGDDALMPPRYYVLVVPILVRRATRELTRSRRTELDRFGVASKTRPELAGVVAGLVDRLLPHEEESDGETQSLDELLERYGFDRYQHEQIRADLRSGRIGLAQNRLPAQSRIDDVEPNDVFDARLELPPPYQTIGLDAMQQGAVAVVTLAGGVGSRWTKGAGVVKALNPFAKIGGLHRNFIEIHLAKSRRVSREVGTHLPHVITTSYMTHGPIKEHLDYMGHYGYAGPLMLSPGSNVGLRLIPMERDLRFAWEEMPQQLLDEQAQKVRESGRAALINWVRQAGEGSDYTDNLPQQCLHPVGHWYDVLNIFKNGVLADLLEIRPQLKYLMVHNIDTLGASIDAGILGYHIEQSATLTTEVITRQIEDKGGGLARVDGHLRLVEGLAMPREDIEYRLSFYNTSTTWIDIDRLLRTLLLTRSDLSRPARVAEAIRELGSHIPTYVTLKDVKKRWGKGQEDVFPVTQFEKLWGDMTALPELDTRFVSVPRMRGQQLKDPGQRDGWLRDGSAKYVERLCDWGEE
ncbi:MAG: UTP--glucose-1-phosphate uridylyltransferase [Rhodothermales bacterium]